MKIKVYCEKNESHFCNELSLKGSEAWRKLRRREKECWFSRFHLFQEMMWPKWAKKGKAVSHRLWDPGMLCIPVAFWEEGFDKSSEELVSASGWKLQKEALHPVVKFVDPSLLFFFFFFKCSTHYVFKVVWNFSQTYWIGGRKKFKFFYFKSKSIDR